jgi:hypothetical protein
MKIFRLIAPNPDTNGVSVNGYDRIQRGEDGVFSVHDSNLADRLRAAPWFFKDAPEPTKPAKPPKKVTEDKTIDEMDETELKAWLTERGEEGLDGFNKADLLALAVAVQKKAESGTKKKKE